MANSEQKLGPKSISVNLALQTLEAYEGKLVVFRFDCVSGDRDHPTDRGIFRIFKKDRIYRSRTYNAQMNYAMFFTQDGKAIHQYHGPLPLSVVRLARNSVTDWVGSHGCIRLSEEDVKALFEWAPMGTPVRIL